MLAGPLLQWQLQQQQLAALTWHMSVTHSQRLTFEVVGAERITRMCCHKLHYLWCTDCCCLCCCLVLLMTWHLNCQGDKCQDIRSAAPIKHTPCWTLKMSSPATSFACSAVLAKTIWCWLMSSPFWAENFQKNGNYISLTSCAIKVCQVEWSGGGLNFALLHFAFEIAARAHTLKCFSR